MSSDVWTGGRFQPFTNDHKDVVDSLLNRFDKVYIGIRYVLERNWYAPFEPEEAAAMIKSVYPSSDVDTFFLRRYNPFRMKKEILQNIPEGTPFFTREKKWYKNVKRLGLPVLPLEERTGGSATDVRVLWYNGDQRFADFIPVPIAEYMRKPEITARIPELKNRKPILDKYGIVPAFVKGLKNAFTF